MNMSDGFSHPCMELIDGCCYFRDPGRELRLLKTSCHDGGCRMGGVVPLIYKAYTYGHSDSPLAG